MVKPKLKAIVREAETENWIKKSELNKHSTAGKKIRLTLYISKEARRLLWHARGDTGKPISIIFEDLVFSRFGKAKQENT